MKEASKSVAIDATVPGRGDISSNSDLTAQTSSTNTETKVDTQTEKSQGRQDPNAILANMFKALTDIMLKVQMGGAQTFPYSTDQSKKIDMTSSMDGAPSATTLEKANQVDSVSSSSSSSTSSMDLESKSVSASEVVQSDVKKDKIVNTKTETASTNTMSEQSAGMTNVITTDAPLATQQPPQTEAPVVENAYVDTGVQSSSGDTSSFAISGSSVMDINSMGNMAIDGQMVDPGMIDATGLGNTAPEWGTGGMTGNVDLMMDTSNLATGANNAWDTTYMFDNTATGGLDMGVGASGSNWDAAFVDSTQPIVDPAVTGNAGASWDAAYNIDNTGLSPASSSSSSSISASSSSSMSSSSIGQSTSTKRVQMTSSSGKEVRVEQPQGQLFSL